MKDIVIVDMEEGDYYIVEKKTFYHIGPMAFDRKYLMDAKRDDIRAISRRHAINNSHLMIDRSWLWNARSELQAQFMLGDPESLTFPKVYKIPSRKPKKLGTSKREYVPQKLRREPTEYPEPEPAPVPEPAPEPEPIPTEPQGIRVDVHFHIHWL